MPLRAFLNGQEITSIEQSDEQWTELKSRIKEKSGSLILPCCNQAGFLRVSTRGLKHFVHSKSDNLCDWKPESPEHLKSKVEIIKACHDNGWKAIPEFSENDWRADVLAINGNVRLAFEVQWSSQTMEANKFRQQRYKESNVRGCWFFRTIPKELRSYDSVYADKDTPSFKVTKGGNGEIQVSFSGTNIPLRSFVDKLLKRKIKFCENYRLHPKQEVEIVVFETTCWKCKKPQHLYTVDQHLKTICEQDMYLMGSMWDSGDIDKSPAVINAIEDLMKSEEGKEIKIGRIKHRYSKTVSHSYLSHGCYYCDVIFGDFPLNSEKLDGLNDPNRKIFKRVLEMGTIKQEGIHWCHSETSNFCE